MIRYNDFEIDQVRGIIRFRGQQLELRCGKQRQRRRRLVERLILAEPQTASELFAFIYPEPDGGPIYGPHVLLVMFNHLRPMLIKVGLRLRGERMCGPKRYWIEPI